MRARQHHTISAAEEYALLNDPARLSHSSTHSGDSGCSRTYEMDSSDTSTTSSQATADFAVRGSTSGSKKK